MWECRGNDGVYVNIELFKAVFSTGSDCELLDVQ